MEYALLEKLRKLNKDYFSFRDLEKILGQKPSVLKVTLNRLVKQGWLTRIRRGVYQLSSEGIDVPAVANSLYQPSYLSFESALQRYGLIDQIPFVITFATVRRTKRMRIFDREVEFRQIKKELFFGYLLQDGLQIAQKEKAFLDQVYLATLGKAFLNEDELNLKSLDLKRLNKWLKKYPERVKEKVRQFL